MIKVAKEISLATFWFFISNESFNIYYIMCRK